MKPIFAHIAGIHFALSILPVISGFSGGEKMGFKHVVLCALLLSSVSVHADNIGWGEDQRIPTRPNFPQTPTRPNIPNDPWGNRNSSASRTVEESIQDYFYDDQNSLDLLSDFSIRSQLQSLRIRDITIVASSEDGQGLASLVLNGQSIDNSQVIAREMRSYTFRVDPFTNTLGQSLRNIQLSMQGQFYVEKVIFNLLGTNDSSGPGPARPQPGPQIEVVRQQLNEHIEEEGGLELFRLFTLGLERQGQAIRRVTITARSRNGFGQASLMVNNQQVSSTQNIGYDSTRLTFDVGAGMRVGQEIRGLSLYFRGDIDVSEVAIEVEKRGAGNGFPPTMDRRIEQVVNQRLFSTSGVDLRSLMQIPSFFDDRIVDSVEVVIRNSTYGTRLQLCQVIQDRFQSVNCGVQVITASGAQVIRLTGVNFAKLRETTLSVRMGMVDVDRIAINFR